MEAFSTLATAGFFVWKSPVTGEFPSQKASNADFRVSLVWVHIRVSTVIRTLQNGSVSALGRFNLSGIG